MSLKFMNAAKQVAKILKDQNWTISTVESCTGGFLANTLTNVSGSSSYFISGYVTYSVESKIQDLDIPRNSIGIYGVYSSHIAELMATEVRRKNKTTFGIAITGIAPPGDPSTDLPTGTVFIGLASSEGTNHLEIRVKDRSRKRFKKNVVKKVLNWFYSELRKQLD